MYMDNWANPQILSFFFDRDVKLQSLPKISVVNNLGKKMCTYNEIFRG